MKKQTKPYGYGALTPEEVIRSCDGTMMQERPDGDWEPIKCIPYYSFKERLVQAWHVLTYQADALYWYFPTGWDRKNGWKKREVTPTKTDEQYPEVPCAHGVSVNEDCDDCDKTLENLVFMPASEGLPTKTDNHTK